MSKCFDCGHNKDENDDDDDADDDDDKHDDDSGDGRDHGGRDVDDEDDDAGVGFRVMYIDRRIAKITASIGAGALSIYVSIDEVCRLN